MLPFIGLIAYNSIQAHTEPNIGSLFDQVISMDFICDVTFHSLFYLLHTIDSKCFLLSSCFSFARTDHE